MRASVRISSALLMIVLASLSSACQPSETISPLPTPPPPPSAVPTTSQRSTPTARLASTAVPDTGNCLNDAVFVEDVTIPDFSLVQPGEVLDKRWNVRNTGTCDWGAGYKLVRVGEDNFQGETELALFPARAGNVAEVQVALTAPDEPGEYISRWQAQSPEGIQFGQEIYLLVLIPTPTPAPTTTPDGS